MIPLAERRRLPRTLEGCLRARKFLRFGFVVGIFWLAMLEACGPASQTPQSQSEQARRKEPRQDEARRDETRRDDSERHQSEEGEGRRHKSKSERRRAREEREVGEENGGRNSSGNSGGSSYDGAPSATASRASDANRPGPSHDLSVDEAQGGHTLRKHVGRSDADLQDRLQREPNISAASTWTDRETAEAAVGSALASNSSRISQWTARGERRPNLAIDYHGDAAKPIGRCLERGSNMAVPVSDAVLVLKAARDGDRYYVLTTYPECPR